MADFLLLSLIIPGTGRLGAERKNTGLSTEDGGAHNLVIMIVDLSGSKIILGYCRSHH